MLFQKDIKHFPIPYDEAVNEEFSKKFDHLSVDQTRLVSATASTSPYLAGLLDKHADWIAKHIDSNATSTLESAIELDSDIRKSLRIAKNRVALVLALCDLAGIYPLEWITEKLTHFADFAVETALQHCLHQEANKNKISDQLLNNGESAGIFVLAMGKMGAKELNYSSDIDLIFLFDDQIYPRDEVAERRAQFSRITRDIFSLLNKTDADGYVFRTDLRLRPNPAVTPVCQSVSSAANYYVKEGRTWERAAFIKARVCAGNKDAGNAFLTKLVPFIWRPQLDFAALGEIEDLLEQSRDHKGINAPIRLVGHNLKIGRGGIREIEFFAQTNQMIFGGRDERLRKITTVGALQVLADTGRIAPAIAEILKTTYRHHRNIEHRIQMLRDSQTHSIPTNDQELDRLRCLSGFNSLEDFSNFVLDNLHKTSEASTPETKPADTPEKVEFSGQEESTIELWKTLPALKNSRSAEIFEKLRPAILSLASTSQNKEQTLEHFEVFLSSLNSSVQLFSLFERRPDILVQAFSVISLSKQLARDLANQVSVLDGLADNLKIKNLAFYQKDTSSILAGDRDFETALIALRKWKSEEQFRIVYGQLSLEIDIAKAELAYTDLATAALHACLEIAKFEMNRRYGEIDGGEVAVLAMGKMGSCEMTCSSDLDLIVIYDGPPDAYSDGRKSWDIRSYYQQLTRILVTALSSSMMYGRLYEVDMRLRPSGRAGTVATSVTGFKEYQETKAWVWEHLALSRARVVAGNPELGNKISNIRKDVLTTKQDAQKTLQETSEMRSRIAKLEAVKPSAWPVKKPLGGVLDIELIAQMSALLCQSTLHKPKEQLIKAQKSGLIPGDLTEKLIASHTFFAKIEHFKRLLGAERFDANLLSDKAIQLILSLTGSESIKSLQKEVESQLLQNNKIITGVLNEIGNPKKSSV